MRKRSLQPRRSRCRRRAEEFRHRTYPRGVGFRLCHQRLSGLAARHRPLTLHWVGRRLRLVGKKFSARGARTPGPTALNSFGFLEAAEVAHFSNENYIALTKNGELWMPGKDMHRQRRRPTASVGGRNQARKFLRQSRRSP